MEKQYTYTMTDPQVETLLTMLRNVALPYNQLFDTLMGQRKAADDISQPVDVPLDVGLPEGEPSLDDNLTQ